MAETITIPIKTLKLVGAFLLILIVIGCAIYSVKTEKDNIELAKQIGFTNGTQIGYQNALISIAYTIATQGEASYIVPTTNITLTLIQKR